MKCSIIFAVALAGFAIGAPTVLNASPEAKGRDRDVTITFYSRDDYRGSSAQIDADRKECSE